MCRTWIRVLSCRHNFRCKDRTTRSSPSPPWRKVISTTGFKPSGNLICPLDNVSNVDSRFIVPAQLSLQGPNNSKFSLSTVAEGYFNNWDTPGAAALGTGFYNLAGKIRVPFFTDVKVHLHVTPVNATTAQVDIMGGWPDPESAADR